jgi:hypothetical protein
MDRAVPAVDCAAAGTVKLATSASAIAATDFDDR